MPRYFFDVRDHMELLDDTGTELRDEEAARTEAVVLAGRLLADLGRKFWDSGDWRLSVREESGRVLFVLEFSAKTSPANDR